MPSPVVLYAEFTARPGRDAELESLLQGLVASVRTEPGNVTFDAYRVADADDRFFVFEAYRNEDAFQAHLSAPYGPPFNEALVELTLEGASRLTFLRRAAEPTS